MKKRLWLTLHVSQLSFSYFEFKVNLIRLGLSFQKQKFLYSTYWFSVRSHNHYTKGSTVSGSHKKAFTNLQSCLTDSSWIHLILLITLIQFTIGKTRLEFFTTSVSTRSKGEHQLSDFVGIEYLLRYAGSNKGRSPEITINAGLSDLLIVKNRIWKKDLFYFIWQICKGLFTHNEIQPVTDIRPIIV